MGKFLLILFVMMASIEWGQNQQRNLASRTQSIPDHNWKRIFLSLDHSHKYRGLFHNEDDYDYARRLFGQIIHQANKLAADDWYDAENNVYKHYNLFLLLSILVPHHESALMHFALRDKKKYCYYSNDILDPVNPKDSPKSYYENQLELLRNSGSSEKDIAKKEKEANSAIRRATQLEMGYSVFAKSMGDHKLDIKHCSKIKSEKVYQLMFSGDYADIGMFMINSRSHGDFFANGGILNFEAVKNYALNFLYAGFRELAMNAESFSCLRGLQETSFYQYSVNILKGSWAGRYNSGRTSKSCRFTLSKEENKYYGNDEGYARSLNKFINEEKLKKDNIFYKYLPLESVERKALLELISNVKNQTNSRVYIQQVLDSNYYSESSSILTDENDHSLSQDETQVTAGVDEGGAVEVEPIKVADVPEPPQVDHDFEQVNKEENMIAVLTSPLVNIRSKPIVSKETVCGNSRLLKTLPVKVVVTGENNKWYEVEAQDLKDTIINDKCIDLEKLYIHKSLVSWQKDFSDRERIKLNTTVTIRSHAGKKSSEILGSLGPSELYLLDTKVLDENYIWVKVLTDTGAEVWFYAGQGNDLKYDYL